MFIDGAVGIFHHKVKSNGRKLDMAYITPQLIASAMPTEHFFQGFYRMNVKHVVDFLDKDHESHWHIWNLQEDCELGYNPSKIRGAKEEEDTTLVTRHPIKDHQPLPFALLVRVATEIRDYIELDPKNVAFVHCKCGKGRTGSVVAAYLMLFHSMDYNQATSAFSQKRIRMGVFNGITIKSQQRFLHYVDSWARANQDLNVLSQIGEIRILQVVIRNPKVQDFDLEIGPLKKQSDKEVGASKWDITYKDKYYLLRPLESCPETGFPVDLIMYFTGYSLQAGYRVPLCSTSFAFNVDFEQNASIFGVADELVSQRALSESSALSSLAATGSCICQWEDTDGIGGLELRGIKGFDSVEIFWKKAETGQTQQGDCFHPSSVSNL